jgi:formate hydrogenlyase subunit 4
VNPILFKLLLGLAALLLAPIAGGLLAGLDRIVTARMQRRVGPPILQPFYDVAKLFEKRTVVVSHFQNFYVACFLLFIALATCLFFMGQDLLLIIFALTAGGVFLVLGAFAPNSPYSAIGAERELLQMMAYEPMLFIMAMGFYKVSNSFHVNAIISQPKGPQLLLLLPGIFFGFLYVLAIKLRKSPFDLSTSHHAHQELVKGLTTEFSGRTLAYIEIGHWYENVLLMGLVWLFFSGLNLVWGIAGVALVYLLEVLVDNSSARLTWQVTLKSAWAVTGILGVVNLIAVSYLSH